MDKLVPEEKLCIMAVFEHLRASARGAVLVAPFPLLAGLLPACQGHPESDSLAEGSVAGDLGGNARDCSTREHGGFVIGFPFGARAGHPTTDDPAGHSGRTSHCNWDLDCSRGERVGAVIGGLVTTLIDGRETGDASYGNQLCIRDLEGRTVCLNHLESQSFAPGLSVGSRVDQGMDVAACGNSGYVIPGPGGDGSHLDVFAVAPDGTDLALADPSRWGPLASFGVSGAQVEFVAPSEGETWVRGKTYSISWSGSASGRLVVVDADGRELPPPILADAPHTGDVLVDVPLDWPEGPAAVCFSTEHTTTCRGIVIESAAWVAVEDPVAGSRWELGRGHRVAWTSDGIATAVRVVVRSGSSELAPPIEAAAPVSGERWVDVPTGWPLGVAQVCASANEGATTHCVEILLAASPSDSGGGEGGNASGGTGGTFGIGGGGAGGMGLGEATTGGSSGGDVSSGGESSAGGGRPGDGAGGGSAGDEQAGGSSGGVPHTAVVIVRCPAGWNIAETYPAGLADQEPGDAGRFQFTFADGERRDFTARVVDPNNGSHWLFDFAPTTQGGSGAIGVPICDTQLTIDGLSSPLRFRPNHTDPGLCIYTNLAVDGGSNGTCF